MAKRIALLFVPLMFIFTGAQCISFSSSGSGGADGGIFVSIDAGDHWLSKGAIPSVSGQPRSMAGTNVLAIARDPQDEKTFVVGTRENGLFYSFDSGETWNQVTGGVSKMAVSAMAVDPRDKCVIYAAVGASIIRSSDCFRTFEEIYKDALPQTQITDLAVDFAATNRVFAATTRGILLRSDTAGRTWSVIWNFGRDTVITNSFMQLAMNASDSHTLYAGVDNVGIWKTTDSGSTWTDLTPTIKKIDDKIQSYPIIIRGMAISRSASNTVVVALGRYGMIRTTDGGASWTSVKLLTEPGNVELRALGVSPQSTQIIYYATASTFYRSGDGGRTWETNRIPTTRVPTVILVDGKDAKKVYMGVVKQK